MRCQHFLSGLLLLSALAAFAAGPNPSAKPSSPLLPSQFAGWQRSGAGQTSKDPAAADAVNAGVLKEYGFTDEGMEKLERVMVERNIGDYEAAAVLMAAKEPKTAEATYDSHYWNHNKKPGWQEIAKDTEAWGRNEILGAIHRDMVAMKNGR